MLEMGLQSMRKIEGEKSWDKIICSNQTVARSDEMISCFVLNKNIAEIKFEI